MTYIIFRLDSVAVEESIQSHLAGWQWTWAKSTAPTAFGWHRVSQGLRMTNGLHPTQEGGEVSTVEQGSNPHSSTGKRVQGAQGGWEAACLEGSLHRVAPQPALG